jgi:DivIVA domain-containing protein
MDVTPQLIEQIDFSDKFRGYDQDEVDDFLERVGATIASLQAQVADLSDRATRAEAEVVSLREHPPAAEPRALSDEEEVEQATRTLVLAKRTAEAAISEARQEASKLVSDARARAESETAEATAEADRLLRDAHTQREEFLRLAREEADSEAVAQRDRLQAEIATLEGRKGDLTGDIARLEQRMADYRRRLEGVHAAIRTVLDDPEALRSGPELEMADSPTSSAFYYTGSNPVVSAAGATPLAAAKSDTGTQAAVAAEPVGADEVSVVDDPEAHDAAPGDPWSPGSWSEVSAALEADGGPIDATLFDDPPGSAGASSFDEPAADFRPADPGSEAVRSHADTPTEAYTDLGTDRYLRDLDEAVNRPAAQDAAMSDFFDGSEGASTRRFGRRR